MKNDDEEDFKEVRLFIILSICVTIWLVVGFIVGRNTRLESDGKMATNYTQYINE